VVELSNLFNGIGPDVEGQKSKLESDLVNSSKLIYRYVRTRGNVNNCRGSSKYFGYRLEVVIVLRDQS
jgi:hypothetical protein